MSCSQHIGGLVAARSALCELWLHGYGFCSLKQPIVLVVLVALSWSVEKAHFLQRQSEKDPCTIIPWYSLESMHINGHAINHA